MNKEKLQIKLGKTFDEIFKSDSEPVRERVVGIANDLLPVVRAEICAKIDSGLPVFAGSHIHDMYNRSEDRIHDQAVLLSYTEVMDELREDNYHVVKLEPREKYNGEGNNMTDFYTVHTWIIRSFD